MPCLCVCLCIVRACMCMHACAHVSVSVWIERRIIYGNWFSSSIVWVLGIKLWVCWQASSPSKPSHWPSVSSCKSAGATFGTVCLSVAWIIDVAWGALTSPHSILTTTLTGKDSCFTRGNLRDWMPCLTHMTYDPSHSQLHSFCCDLISVQIIAEARILQSSAAEKWLSFIQSVHFAFSF